MNLSSKSSLLNMLTIRNLKNSECWPFSSLISDLINVEIHPSDLERIYAEFVTA